MKCIHAAKILVLLVIVAGCTVLLHDANACDCPGYYPDFDCCVDCDWDFPVDICEISCDIEYSQDCRHDSCYITPGGSYYVRVSCEGSGDSCEACVVQWPIKIYTCEGPCTCLKYVEAKYGTYNVKCMKNSRCKCVPDTMYIYIQVCEKIWF